MGVYYDIHLDSILVEGGKSFIPDSLLSMFQESDRQILTISEMEKKYPHLIDTDTLDDDEAFYYLYVAKAETIKMRLDIAGINLALMKKSFETTFSFYREVVAESYARSLENYKNIYGNRTSDYKIGRLDVGDYNFETWISYVKINFDRNNEILNLDVVEPLGIDSYCYEYFSETSGFPYDKYDARYLIRIALDIYEGQEIILNYTDFVYQEAISKDTELITDAKIQEAISIPLFEKAIVLTEGTSDTYFLSNCLTLLYPEIKDEIHFVDFSETKAGGGASQIVAFIKIFAAAGIRNRIIALFDADSAAKDAIRVLNEITLPNNITVTVLPSQVEFKQWPTLGPQGDDVEVDINGTAVSLELFFPSDEDFNVKYFILIFVIIGGCKHSSLKNPVFIRNFSIGC